MTNIMATISLVVVTNWLTTSITSPVIDNPTAAVMRYETENQIGARVTNTVATIVWNGKTNQMILESTRAFYAGDLKREKLRSPIQQFLQTAP
jgi:hypothetical protein